MTRDADLRLALRAQLVVEQPDWALVLDEFGLNHGDVRVDVAVLNGCLHGYELKSDLDTLDRLPRQVSAYSAVLDFATLVVSPHHLQAAGAQVPEWWGLLEAREVDGAVCLRELREARRNPSVDALARARLLWRDEALELLIRAGAARGLRGRPRADLYERLVSVLGRETTLLRVLEAVRARGDWR